MNFCFESVCKSIHSDGRTDGHTGIHDEARERVPVTLQKHTRRDVIAEANKWLLVPSHGWGLSGSTPTGDVHACDVKPLCLGFQAFEVGVVKVIVFWVVMQRIDFDVSAGRCVSIFRVTCFDSGYITVTGRSKWIDYVF